MQPSGAQFSISSRDLRAVITESGAALRGLWASDRPLIDGFAEDQQATGGRGQVLIPWPNRIRDGRYTFDGTTRQLALSEPKLHNAIHGLVRWAAFTPVKYTTRAVTMRCRVLAQPGYPWSLEVEVCYEIDESGLVVTHRATNLGTTTAPYAAGMHPYLRAGTSAMRQWEVTVPAASRQLTDERNLPVGQEAVVGTPYDFPGGRQIGDLDLDDAFTELTRDEQGIARVMLRDLADGTAVQLWADDAHRWLQLYTGDGSSLAVEPMTAPADAFNSGTDLIRLAPGERFEARWGITPG